MTAGPTAPARTARRHGVFHPLAVSAVERLTDDAVAVDFHVPEELREDYAFRPGQHLTVRAEVAGVEVRRNYSICVPATGDRLSIAVKRLGGGVFSEWANAELRVGHVLDVMTPTGFFGVELGADCPRSFAAIAAGSGITPVLSILATALEVEPASRCTLLYVNRTVSSVMFLEELEDLKDRYPDRFQLIHVLSREPQDAPLLSGRLDAARLAGLLDALVDVPSVDAWFLCGPVALVEMSRETLLARGVEADSVHAELFHVEGEPLRAARDEAPGERRPGQTSAVTFVLDGRTSNVDVARDGESLLDAALRVRPDAPYACKGGVCGTCRAKVVDGEVRMAAHYALERSEIESGFVLTCQSRPVTDRLTVDFDQ